MKHISILALSVILIPFGSHAAALSPFHANQIVANNISVIQHSITINAYNNFDGSPAAALGKRSMPQPTVTDEESKDDSAENKDKRSIYGTMPMYGEYGDDGTVFSSGRNGGDMTGELPTLNSMWFGWQHTKDYAKYKDFGSLDSKNDLISFGISGGQKQISGGVSGWGIFGGLVFADEEDKDITLSENGGYVGVYHDYHIYGFNFAMSANIGTMFNSAESIYGTDDFANLWFGGAVNASYNIVLDDTFTLQPGIYGGYTWVRSQSYMAMSGDKVSNDNLNMFEVSPSLRAIKHIANNWYGIASARYVFNFVNGGNTSVAGADLKGLELLPYSEYGLSLEKNIERFNFAVSISRRDVGRTGWNGGLHIRYVF